MQLPKAHQADDASQQLRVLVETFAGARVAAFDGYPDMTVRDVCCLVEEQHPEFRSGDQHLFTPGSELPLPGTLELGAILQQLQLQRQQQNHGDAARSLKGVADQRVATTTGGDGDTSTSRTAATTVTLVVALQAQKWSRATSNTFLEFLKSDRAIKRPGSASSYPCGRTNDLLQRPGSSFCVRITELPPKHNALTIGILTMGLDKQFGFANQSSGGVGSNNYSMGIHVNSVHTRLVGSAKNDPKQCVKVCGKFVGPKFAMFQEGDCLRFTVIRRGNNSRSGVGGGGGGGRSADFMATAQTEEEEEEEEAQLLLEIKLNNEPFYTVPMPPQFTFPFQPLCTLPDDCVLELVP